MNHDKKTILVTGVAGFIGSNLVPLLLSRWPDTHIVGVDALTYSGHEVNMTEFIGRDRFDFRYGSIVDRGFIRSVFDEHRPAGVIHLAAESHVDRSIASPMAFVESNVVGTVVLLQEAERAWADGHGRFHHVSTDEVFGSLGEDGYFDESTPYSPNSPYSASKAASDHFVRAWGETYGLDFVITNCTNNYGPRQFPEKLIPVVIDRARRRLPVPIYGEGRNVRDWLHVDDHCSALATVFEIGTSGTTYCIGGESELTNRDLVDLILDEVDRHTGNAPGTSRDLITFVKDRPGHDLRYAMDISRIRADLGWEPATKLQEGISQTVKWYLDNERWAEAVSSADHTDFQARWYQEERAGA